MAYVTSLHEIITHFSNVFIISQTKTMLYLPMLLISFVESLKYNLLLNSKIVLNLFHSQIFFLFWKEKKSAKYSIAQKV